MGFIGFEIYFCIEKSVERVYGSYGPTVSGSTMDRPWEGGRSSLVLRGAGACCESLGRERVTPRSSPRSELGGAVAESCRRGRGLAAVVGAQRARPSERGEEGMMMGTSCGGGGWGIAPFYRVEEVADQVVMAVVVRFQGGGRLRMGRRCRLREGKGGGG
jgi:hypothetical protein